MVDVDTMKTRETLANSQVSCRLHLRAPGLLDPEFWVPSICVCLHAAHGILYTYLELYQGALETLCMGVCRPEQSEEDDVNIVACMLPVTWRQVKRIMTSAFVVMVAFWQNEITHSEATRYIAMARLLLDYPRWRWTTKLDPAVQILLDFARLEHFNLDDAMRNLLPQAYGLRAQPSHVQTPSNFAPQAGILANTASDHAIEPVHIAADEGGLYRSVSSLDASSTSCIANDVPFGFCDPQSLNGFWQTVELGCPTEAGTWTPMAQ